MITVSINLYSLDELSQESKDVAIQEHKDFLDSMPIDFEDEDGNLNEQYHSHSEQETIDNIYANEYIYFGDGTLANCTTYTGKHPKAGTTEFNFKGKIYKVK